MSVTSDSSDESDDSSTSALEMHLSPAPPRTFVVTIRSIPLQKKELRRRLDSRFAKSLVVVGSVLSWTLQLNVRLLHALCRNCPAPLRASGAPGLLHAFDSLFGAKLRHSFIMRSRLCVALAVNWVGFRNECSGADALVRARHVLSRLFALPLGIVPGGLACSGTGFVRAIGSEGGGHAQLRGPYAGVAFDGEGNLVVSDGQNHRLQVFRYSDGAHVRTIGSVGHEIGQFHFPWGIAFDDSGHIIVSDRENNRVQVLRYSDASHVLSISPSPAALGAGDEERDAASRKWWRQAAGGGLDRRDFEVLEQIRKRFCPTGIAVDSEGNIAVFDHNNSCVRVFRVSDGAQLHVIGREGSAPGHFSSHGYAGVAFDVDGNLVVADMGNNCIQILRYSDGSHMRSIGGHGTGPSQFVHPTGVAFDSSGHLAVVELGNHRVQVFRYSDGAHVRTIGSEGSGDGLFSNPYGGIAIDSNGCVVVSDTHNHRVQIIN
jgi:DNA-binding beta-propeller fold protein YncE